MAKKTVEKVKKITQKKSNLILTLPEEDEIQNYFDDIKSKVTSFNKESLEQDLQTLPKYIEYAKKNGQISLEKKLKEQAYTIIRERVLLRSGINKKVTLEDIVRFIDSIKNHVIKFCELELFPRVIPLEVSEKIQKCKEAELFDAYYILFTDYINEEFINEEQKKTRKINKDPIVFGTINNSKEKYYFIADWIDEYCDISFDSFVGKLKEIKKEYEPENIPVDLDSYLNTIVIELTKEQKEKEEEAKKRLEMKERKEKPRGNLLGKFLYRCFKIFE